MNVEKISGFLKTVKSRTIRLAKLTFKKMLEPYFEGAAAELAFFFLLSIVPTLILLAQLLGVFSLSMDVLQEVIKVYVSEEIFKAIAPFFSYKSSGAISIVFVVLALWAASKVQFSLMRITNYAYTGKTTGEKGYIRERIRAIKTIAILLPTLVFALVILVYGESIADVILSYINDFLGMDVSIGKVWYFIRWPVAMGLYFFMVTWIYYELPAVKPPFKSILPGSIFASVGMLLATWIYSYYTQVFANYDLLYGSLASIVALLFWFYILGYVLITGVQINSVWEDSRLLTAPEA